MDVLRRHYRVRIVTPPHPFMDVTKHHLCVQFPHSVFPLSCFLNPALVGAPGSGGQQPWGRHSHGLGLRLRFLSQHVYVMFSHSMLCFHSLVLVGLLSSGAWHVAQDMYLQQDQCYHHGPCMHSRHCILLMSCIHKSASAAPRLMPCDGTTFSGCLALGSVSQGLTREVHTLKRAQE